MRADAHVRFTLLISARRNFDSSAISSGFAAPFDIGVAADRFEGTGIIPIPGDQSLFDGLLNGDVGKGGPQDPLSNLAWSKFCVPFPLFVELPVKGVPE